MLTQVIYFYLAKKKKKKMVIKIKIPLSKDNIVALLRIWTAIRKQRLFEKLSGRKMLSSDHVYLMYKVDRCPTLGRILSCYRKKIQLHISWQSNL